MLQGRLKGVSMKFKWDSMCFQEVQWMFEESFKGVSRMYQGSLKGVTTKIEGCSQIPSMVIQGSFNGI